jgi:hypothetical protein
MRLTVAICSVCAVWAATILGFVFMIEAIALSGLVWHWVLVLLGVGIISLGLWLLWELWREG